MKGVWTCTSALLLCSWGGIAEVASLQAPSAVGSIFHRASASIRPIIGFPGSSYLGDAIVQSVESAFIAPDGDTVLAIVQGQAVLIQGLQTGELVEVPVPTIAAPVGSVAWAGNSKAFVTYSNQMRALQVCRLTGSSVQANEAIDLTYLEGDVSGMAIQADATQIVIGVRNNAGRGGLYVISETMPAVMIMESSAPGPMAFSTSSNLLYAINHETGSILRFGKGPLEGWETLTFSGEDSPLTDMVGIALSSDERQLYVASGNDRRIRQYDLATRRLVQEVTTSIAPSGLTRLSASAPVFRLGEEMGTEQPIWLFDGRGAGFAFFVPAVPVRPLSKPDAE